MRDLLVAAWEQQDVLAREVAGQTSLHTPVDPIPGNELLETVHLAEVDGARKFRISTLWDRATVTFHRQCVGKTCKFYTVQSRRQVQARSGLSTGVRGLSWHPLLTYT